MKKLSNIIFWLLFAVSIVMLVVFFVMPTEKLELSNGNLQDVSTFLDPFMYWMYAVVGVGIVALLLFAVMGIVTDFKKAVGGIIGVAAVAVLLAVCYFLSGETEFSRIVNGETEVYSETTMKMIDMWLYSIYALFVASAALVIVFPLLRAIKVIK